jgi:hypothetical protein
MGAGAISHLILFFHGSGFWSAQPKPDSLPSIGKIFRSVTHHEIALGQACLTLKFFRVGLPEKKVYLGGMSIVSILLSIELECPSFIGLFGRLQGDCDVMKVLFSALSW